MAYTIFNTRNNEVTVVEDGTIDNTTDLKLIGKNYSGYGEIQNENFVYLLENFASANQPPRPIAGQLWFDTDDGKIKLYDGNAEKVFVPLGNLHVGALPTGAAITAANVKKGDLWWDDVTNQLYTHNGSTTGDPFVLIGPKAAGNVLTDIVETIVYDNLLVDGDPSPGDHEHRILRGVVDNRVVFIVSNDEFTLDNSNAISGFDRIKKGITLVNTEIANNGVTQDNYNFWGTASNTLQLGGVAAAEFVQRTNPVFQTEVNINDNDGILIGPNDEAILRVQSGQVELASTINGARMNFKVNSGAGTAITPLTLTTAGPMPLTDNSFDIGSNSLRWNEVFAVNFRGIADNANFVLSDGTFKSATRNNTANTLVTRDSVGDIYGTAFRGTHIYNSSDADAAITARVTRADSVLVAGTSTYVNASSSATANTLALRDNSGNLVANTFTGLATRAATLRISTGVDSFEYRTASVADSNIVPNSVAVRDATGRLHAAEFVGTVNGTATAATILQTPRRITLTGDASGNVLFDGSSDVEINVSTTVNAVALGTDTTGNYVQSVSAGSGEQYLNVRVNNTLNGPAAEAAGIVLDLDASTANEGSKLVARDGSGNFAGQIITAESKFVGQINETGTDKDGYFNNLYAANISFGSSGTTLPIATGGTGATTAPSARTNLDVYSKSEVDSAVSSAVGSISTTSIVNGSSSVSVALNSNITFSVGGSNIGEVTSDGIELNSTYKFYGDLEGNAASANYADLAEKYTTDNNTPPGTVVMVCEHEDHELEPCTEIGFPVGVVSTDPAFLMNSGLENGVAIALKGRVPTRVVGPVKKGDLLFAGPNGCAVKQGVYKVAVALESNSEPGEKLVECMLVV